MFPPMRHYLLLFLTDMRQSYWFVPAVMTLAAIVLGAAMPWLDAALGDGWMGAVPFIHALDVEGARGILTTIAGSVIGVAGVTFSIAIAAVSFASGTYGPRLIGNFMRDRGNQVTLGTFVSAFVYCVVVLRAVQSPLGEDVAANVPQIAVLVAMGLMLASIAVLIFFIHHVPESINIMNIAARIGTDLRASVHALFPERTGEVARTDEARTNEATRERPPTLAERGFDEEDAYRLTADGTGYLQRYDLAFLDRTAERNDLVVRLLHRPGSFVVAGDAVLLVWPREVGGAVDGAIEALHGGFVLGTERTDFQDVLFLIDELVEIAARALSPGVNDPFTANTCMDWLGRGLIEFARRAPEDELAPDGDERVVAYPVTFGAVMDAAWNQARQYVARDRNATLHALATLGRIGASCPDEGRRGTVLRHIEALAAAAAREADDARAEEIETRRVEAVRVARGQDAIGHGDTTPASARVMEHPDARAA